MGSGNHRQGGPGDDWLDSPEFVRGTSTVWSSLSLERNSMSLQRSSYLQFNRLKFTFTTLHKNFLNRVRHFSKLITNK